MKCKQIHQRLWDYVGGALPPAEREAFEAHLQSCEACRLELKAAQATLVSLRNLRRYSASESLKMRVRERVRQQRSAPRIRWAFAGRRWALVPALGALSALVVFGGLNLFRQGGWLQTAQADTLSEEYAQTCVELHEQMEVADWAPSPTATYWIHTSLTR